MQVGFVCDLTHGIGPLYLFMKNSMWEFLKGGVMCASRTPIPIIIMVETLSCIWHECNNIRYNRVRSQVPIWKILQNTVGHVKALMDLCSSDKKQHRWNKDLKLLEKAAQPPALYMSS